MVIHVTPQVLPSTASTNPKNNRFTLQMVFLLLLFCVCSEDGCIDVPDLAILHIVSASSSASAPGSSSSMRSVDERVEESSGNGGQRHLGSPIIAADDGDFAENLQISGKPQDKVEAHETVVETTHEEHRNISLTTNAPTSATSPAEAASAPASTPPVVPFPLTGSELLADAFGGRSAGDLSTDVVVDNPHTAEEGKPAGVSVIKTETSTSDVRESPDSSEGSSASISAEIQDAEQTDDLTVSASTAQGRSVSRDINFSRAQDSSAEAPVVPTSGEDADQVLEKKRSHSGSDEIKVNKELAVPDTVETKASTVVQAEDADDDSHIEFREGDKVEARFKGSKKHYPGKVFKDNSDGTFDIKFDDGDRDRFVPKGSIRKLGSRSQELSEDGGDGSAKLCEGDKVEARCKGSKKYYPGKIFMDKRDGTFDIKFDDGDRDRFVPNGSIRKLGSRSQGFSEDGDDILCTGLREGDEVQASCKGSKKTYPGKIFMDNHDGTYDVKFDDGDRDRAVAKRQITKLGEPKLSNSTSKLREGDKVQSSCKGSKRMYPGKIFNCNHDGTYDVKFDDGDRDRGVPEAGIRKEEAPSEEPVEITLWEGAKVSAKYKSPKFFPGTIFVKNTDGTYGVKFDNGWELSSVPMEHIRLQTHDAVFELRKGDEVYSKSREPRSKSYPGKIINCRPDGTYDVTLEDGETRCEVPRAHISERWRHDRYKVIEEQISERDVEEAKLHKGDKGLSSSLSDSDEVLSSSDSVAGSASTSSADQKKQKNKKKRDQKKQVESPEALCAKVDMEHMRLLVAENKTNHEQNSLDLFNIKPEQLSLVISDGSSSDGEDFAESEQLVLRRSAKKKLRRRLHNLFNSEYALPKYNEALEILVIDRRCRSGEYKPLPGIPVAQEGFLLSSAIDKTLKGGRFCKNCCNFFAQCCKNKKKKDKKLLKKMRRETYTSIEEVFESASNFTVVSSCYSIDKKDSNRKSSTVDYACCPINPACSDVPSTTPSPMRPQLRRSPGSGSEAEPVLDEREGFFHNDDMANFSSGFASISRETSFPVTKFPIAGAEDITATHSFGYDVAIISGSAADSITKNLLEFRRRKYLAAFCHFEKLLDKEKEIHLAGTGMSAESVRQIASHELIPEIVDMDYPTKFEHSWSSIARSVEGIYFRVVKKIEKQKETAVQVAKLDKRSKRLNFTMIILSFFILIHDVAKPVILQHWVDQTTLCANREEHIYSIVLEIFKIMCVLTLSFCTVLQRLWSDNEGLQVKLRDLDQSVEKAKLSLIPRIETVISKLEREVTGAVCRNQIGGSRHIESARFEKTGTAEKYLVSRRRCWEDLATSFAVAYQAINQFDATWTELSVRQSKEENKKREGDNSTSRSGSGGHGGSGSSSGHTSNLLGAMVPGFINPTDIDANKFLSDKYDDGKKGRRGHRESVSSSEDESESELEDGSRKGSRRKSRRRRRAGHTRGAGGASHAGRNARGGAMRKGLERGAALASMGRNVGQSSTLAGLGRW